MSRFWAKTTHEGNPGITVYEHMVHVGSVAKCFAELSLDLPTRFRIKASEVGILAALHDIGKISPGFQCKCRRWLEENGLITIARNGCWDTGMESHHGKVSHSAIQTFLSDKGFNRKTAQFVSTVLGGHHGRLGSPNPRGYRPHKGILDQSSGIDWDGERTANAQLIWDRFGGCDTRLIMSKDSPSLWWLAGLTTVADWIGSNESFFSAEHLEDEQKVFDLAAKALNSIGFGKTQFGSDLSFHDLFHDAAHPEIQWKANEMQEKSFATITEPGVYVIEAPMGQGKTEAALWAAYNLLLSGKANGIYFALPTQATSNRIHLRLNDFLNRIAPEAGASRLIHANSWLMDTACTLSPSVTTAQGQDVNNAQVGRDWFSSSKRALLAPFGVGTVDQALLGVVAVKHFFVRHFALAGKVVILDEVHSYDLYTGTLIDKLITTLEGLGCTVIVLSATLTGKRRGEIVSLPDTHRNVTELPYPLITGRKEEEIFVPVAATPPKPRTIHVEFIDVLAAEQEAVSLAKKGGTVLWICDTVNSAQQQFNHFLKHTSDSFPIGLLHSRFPFWRREELENEWMERFGKDGKTRCGSILVSTQVVEQSVDLDADLLISELAPTDMLLQRLGRLWRHDRRDRPADSARICIINEWASLEEFRDMDVETIRSTFGGKAWVYDPFVLLRTLQLWHKEKYSEITMPTQIRELIEATYRFEEDDPAAWEELDNDRFADNSNKRFMAAMNSQYWQPELLDVEGVQTRLNDIPTVPLILCRSINNHEAYFIDKSIGKIRKNQFLLFTAQAIHKNLVKIPEYCFDEDGITPNSAFSDYLFGLQCVGLVSENGVVSVKGLKEEYQLFYSNELGLVIQKISEKEEI